MTDLPTDGCSGFQLLELVFPTISNCCAIHDNGGTDGMLMDCLQGNLPPWAWAGAAFCVALMVLWRPIYRHFQRMKTKADNHR